MSFSGFPATTVRFLTQLSRNNHKEWFDAHRADYAASLIEPASAFIEELAPRLRKIDPRLQAVPKVNGSILRLNRDIRFSKDKTPYKDHLDLWFWAGDKRGWDAPGFFFRLTSKRLILGTGMHAFTPPLLASYREQVQGEPRGKELVKLRASLSKRGYALGGETYKKTPSGVAQDHPRARLLRHSGLYASLERTHPKELGSARFVNLVATHFTALAPLHRWLSGLSR
jgi:uncharacterized protein (TIGR02453 family)